MSEHNHKAELGGSDCRACYPAPSPLKIVRRGFAHTYKDMAPYIIELERQNTAHLALIEELTEWISKKHAVYHWECDCDAKKLIAKSRALLGGSK